MDNQRVLLKMIKIYSTQVNVAKHNHFRPLPMVGSLYVRTEEINSKWTLVSVTLLVSLYSVIKKREY